MKQDKGMGNPRITPMPFLEDYNSIWEVFDE